MGNQRTKGSKGTRTGAPLTHRQQKQQRRTSNHQRQAQTMQPARQELRHQPQMRVAPRPEDAPQPAVHLDAGAVAALASEEIGDQNTTDENATSMIVDIEVETNEQLEAEEEAAIQPARLETLPSRSGAPREAARNATDASVESPEEESQTKPATPAARKRSAKYPTLARMAAIAPAASTSASSPAQQASPPAPAPLAATDVPVATPSAASTREAEVEETETVETPSRAAMRAVHTGDTDVNRAAARDDAPEVYEPRKPVTTRRLSQVAQPDDAPEAYEPRKPVTTRRLSEVAQPDVHAPSAPSASSDATARRLESAAAKAVAGAREARRQASQESRDAGIRRPRPLPEIDLVLPVAAGHIIVAFAAALTGAILLLVGQGGALWPLTLSGVLGIGAWLAYIVSQRSTARSLAGGVLLASQLGALGWMFALLGARASLLALAPAMLLLALRTAGQLSMSLGALVTFALYVAAELFATALPISQPALSPTQLAVIDGVVVFVGLFTLLILALDLQNGRARALAHARANRHEARLLRERSALLRQQLEEDAALLDEELSEALHGHGIDPTAMEQVDSMLSPLVERVIAVADRLETLQRDREDRLRLEGAVRQVTRALERGWLGLQWAWPDSSGTLLDELVALLRAPNPRQMSLWREETSPALVPIPSLDPDLTPRPWETADTPDVNPYARHETRADRPGISNHPSLPNYADHRAIPTHGISDVAWPAPMRSDNFAQQPAPEPYAVRARANPLPWEEWDTWGIWDAAGRDD